jgi:hypothetical protein
LAQNDYRHGLRGQPGAQRSLEDYYPKLKGSASGQSGEAQVLLTFYYPETFHERLEEVVKTSDSLQKMVAARPEPQFTSHGTGLYLANLAASAVGWKLEFDDYSQPGVLVFSLRRRDVEVEP